MATSFQQKLRTQSELQPFFITKFENTSKEIGRGAYGRVVEIIVDGAICAAKEIHDVFVQQQLKQEEPNFQLRAFLRECKLMSSLRHPNITQFLGFCFLSESAKYPALVMERLATNLHDTLENKENPTVHIPLKLKFSILRDVACGLAYIHRQNPPVIHRDLSAANVLLTAAVEAKIADFGMARKIDNKMTSVPGNQAYMPPEAMDSTGNYTSSLDIFSWGVLAIFTLTEKFPEPLGIKVVMDSGTKFLNELERREHYMNIIRLRYDSKDQTAQPVIPLIEKCLKDSPKDRPVINCVLDEVTKLRDNNMDANFPDQDEPGTKLHFIKNMKLKRELNIKETQITRLKDESKELKKSMCGLQIENKSWIGEVENLKRQNEEMMGKLIKLHPGPEKQMVRHQTSPAMSRPAMHKSQKKHFGVHDEILSCDISAPYMKLQPLPSHKMQRVQHWKKPLTLKWEQGKNIPFGAISAQAVTIGESVYIGGGYPLKTEEEGMIQVYNRANDAWDHLPQCPTQFFSVSMDGKEILVGCGKNNLFVFKLSPDEIWIQVNLSPIPKEHICTSAVFICFHDYYIIACGYNEAAKPRRSVLVCNKITGKWHTAESLPLSGHSMCSVIRDGTWYLSGTWEDSNAHIYKVSLDVLIKNATKAQGNTVPAWTEIQNPPYHRFYLLTFRNLITIIGGKNCSQDIYQYDDEIKVWFKVGLLPVALDAPIAVEFPDSGELFVACGGRKGKAHSEHVWIGKIIT